MDIYFRDILLRDMRPDDIDDEIRWMNNETEWIKADTPWEIPEPVDESTLRYELREMISIIPPDAIRSRLEIVFDGNHIGFVCMYPFTISAPSSNEASESDAIAVGIEICNPFYWGKGLGTQALIAWINYCLDHCNCDLYLETWSGNIRMLRCAQSLGFQIHNRIRECHTVDGIKYDSLTLKLDKGLYKTRQAVM